jgi:hypothetical protein
MENYDGYIQPIGSMTENNSPVISIPPLEKGGKGGFAVRMGTTQ